MEGWRIALAGLVLTGAGQAQIGPVLNFEKVSSLEGGFTGQLGVGDQFGASIDQLVYPDGSSLLAVGAHKDDDGGENKGAVWLIARDSEKQVTAVQKISETEGGLVGPLTTRGRFGRGVTFIGDHDGDGIEDLAVGAYWDLDGGVQYGAIWILFMNADLTVKAEQKISSLEGGFTGELLPKDRLGRNIAYLGDLDGDGIGDLATGTENGDGGTNHGAVWILFLNIDGTVKAHQKISTLEGGFTGELDDNDYFGWDVDCLGDFDLDGIPDLLVSAVFDDDGAGGGNRGAFYLLFLNTDGTVKEHRKISQEVGGFTGNVGDEHFAYSAGVLGDLDGNGTVDIAVGAPRDSTYGLEKGSVWILLLNPDGTVLASDRITDDTGAIIDAQDWFGSTVAPAGDLNGDGWVDVLVGARFDDDGGLNYGAIYEVHLTSVSPPVAKFEANFLTGVAPLKVLFTDLSTGFVSGIEWDFGDTHTSTEDMPLHNYTVPGTYTVSLEAVGADGTDVVSMVDLIAVDELYGCNVNPKKSLTVLEGFPSAGETFTVGINNPLGTQAANSATALLISLLPDPNFPCGTNLPGFGMDELGADGELLVSVTGSLLVAVIPGAAWTDPATPVPIPLPFPDDASLVGVQLYLQGIVADPAPHFALTSGIRTTIRP